MIELSVGLTTFAANDPGDWAGMFERAETFERAGFDRIVVSDHVVFGDHLDAYGDPRVGGTAGGRQPTGPDGHWLEPLTVLAMIAARTNRIRLGTNIILAALRRPVVLAKTTSTLDVLSGGRLDLGVGVGWQREEYEAAELDFDDRGRLLDETLALCRAYWTQPDVDGFHMMPKPAQAGGVPIWVSGTVNRAVARRLARHGAGWIPWGADAADPATAVPRMRHVVEQAGGDPNGFGVVGSIRLVRDGDVAIDVDATLQPVTHLVAAGVTDVRLQGAFPEVDDLESQLARLVGMFREMVSGADRDAAHTKR
jgi:probable F420-dependent oxidoreductase